MSGMRRLEVIEQHTSSSQAVVPTNAAYDEPKRTHFSSYHKAWRRHPDALSPHLKSRTVAYIGAPMVEGQEIGGVEKGPMALRRGGIAAIASELGWRFEDGGDVDVVAAANTSPPDAIPVKGVQNAARLGRALEAIHRRVGEEAQEGKFVLTAGGDHSIAAATIPAMKAAHPDLCVVWVDAHADCNTPNTTPSQHYHGMPAAHVMGWFGADQPVPYFEWLTREVMVPTQKIAFVGMRDLDEKEIRLLREHGANVWTMHEIDKWGIGQVMEMALHRINPKGDCPVHLSFDIDGCDPSIAPGTGTCSRGGLSYRESHFICETLATRQNLVSMDLVEVNPDLDTKVTGRMHGDDPRIHSDLLTVRLALELIASALGKGLHY